MIRFTSLLPNMHHLPSPNQRLKHSRHHARLSLSNLTLNLCSLSFFRLLAFFLDLPPLQIFPAVPLPESQLRSLPTTGDFTFLFPSQRPFIAEPEATCPCFAEPRALRSVISNIIFEKSCLSHKLCVTLSSVEASGQKERARVSKCFM